MKKSRFTSFGRLLLMTVFAILGTNFAQAQTFIGGGGNSFWSNADNWIDGLKPEGMFSEATISADVVVDENVSIGTLKNAGSYSITILSGQRININANLDWGDNAFVLEDKAQVVYQDPIRVIMKKHVSAFDADTHLWNLFASPMREDITPSTENGILTDPDTGYALLAYNESAANWIDYKENPFVLELGKSYLYANALDTTLVFEGTTMGYSATIPLAYHTANGAFAGCNFIGNPLPCNAYLNRSYYFISEESNSLIAVPKSITRSIAPCTGIILNTNGPEETDVSFEQMPFSQNLGLEGTIEITAAKSNAPSLVLDQAILSFNPDDDLGKLAIFEGAPSVYFTKDGNDLAILSIDSVDVQPLKFKARENGSYTIHFELQNLSPSYLHLIDNVAGNNIDLLATPHYTFNASTTDYSSRFKLVFDPHYGIEEDGPSTSSGSFAYYANGQIIINDEEMCHSASLQVVDLTGRVVLSEAINERDVACNVSTLSPGVYLMRLTNANTVWTQKIVIH